MQRRRIHILSVINDLYFGGDEYRLHDFACHIDRDRFRHSVLVVNKEDRRLGERYGSMRDQYRNSGIRLLDLDVPAGLVNSPTRNGIAKQYLSANHKIRQLSAVIRRESVDVLDVHLPPGNPICAVAALQRRTPFAVTLYQVSQIRSKKLWLAAQFNLGCAHRLITDSHSQAERIRAWLLRRPRIDVIANGPAEPRPKKSRKETLEFFGIRDQPGLKIIAQISSLQAYKGQQSLIAAAKRILHEHPHCLILLVGYERGDPGYRRSLLQYAAELGIANSIRIAGYPGNIGDVWNVVDIHVHASHLDSLPNAILESMSLGKPAIATSVGGIPEVIKNGINGLIVNPGDPEQLADAVISVLRDPELGKRLGTTAQDTYAKHFGPAVMTRRLEVAFSSLVSMGKARMLHTDSSQIHEETSALS